MHNVPSRPQAQTVVKSDASRTRWCVIHERVPLSARRSVPDVSRKECISPLLPQNTRESCSCKMRQFNSCALSQKSRGDQIFLTLRYGSKILYWCLINRVTLLPLSIKEYIQSYTRCFFQAKDCTVLTSSSKHCQTNFSTSWPSTSLKMLLVAPAWPPKPWFPSLMNLVYSRPHRLPYRKDVVIDLSTNKTPLNICNLSLSIWSITGNQSEGPGFQNKHFPLPPPAGEQELHKGTTHDGIRGQTGARNKVWTQLTYPIYQLLEILTYLFNLGLPYNTVNPH